MTTYKVTAEIESEPEETEEEILDQLMSIGLSNIELEETD